MHKANFWNYESKIERTLLKHRERYYKLGMHNEVSFQPFLIVKFDIQPYSFVFLKFPKFALYLGSRELLI